MPIYEYRCDSCAHQFETIQAVGARPLRKCPECSGRLSKLVSRASFQLRGGGWFAHQYSKSESKPAADATKTPAPEKKATESGKKPE